MQEIALVYQGNVDRAVVRIAEVFKPAIRRNSSAMIVVHNHPAGTLDPSLDDLDLTDSCIQMGKQLDITLIDHLIISAGRWVSVRTWVEQHAETTAQKEAV